MEHNHAPQPMMLQPRPSPVHVLAFRDAMLLDPDPVRALFAQKGEVEAEEIICRVLEDVAFRLDRVQSAIIGHKMQLVTKPARRIAIVAGQIGLSDVAATAFNLSQAAENADGVALAAIAARLERAFDFAVTDIWRYRDIV